MKKPYQNIIHQLKIQFRSEHFSDAIRTTACIFLPTIFFFYMGYNAFGIASATGALLIAATDGPNTLQAKIRSAIENLLLFGVTSILICYSFWNIPIASLVLFIATFFCAIIACYGQRYALSGTMATGLCIFIIGLKPAYPVQFIFGILTGGTIYYLMSILHQLLLPFRSLEQAISECLKATSDFVKTKADCYDYLLPLSQAQNETILQHIKVSEKQQLIRSLLLAENPKKMQRSAKGRKLFQISIILIDLYQQFSASHHNYQKIRNELQGTGTLESIIKLINLQSLMIYHLDDKQRVKSICNEIDIENSSLEHLSKQLNSTQQQLTLAIGTNLQNSYRLIKQLSSIADETIDHKTAELSSTSFTDYQNFISPPPLTLATLIHQFDFKNPIFRFSLRLALLLSLSYLITESNQLSKYTYWLLLTILVVARPKLALTFKRNKQRLIGTMIGIIVSILFLLSTTHSFILLPAVVVFVTAFFFYARLNYLIAVAAVTPAILITLALYDENWPLMLAQRFLFTIIGCMLALLTAFLFPIWETSRIKELLIKTYTTAVVYLKASLQNQSTNPTEMAELRLARKENYLATAELFQAMQMIIIEPSSKKLPITSLKGLQISAFQISSIISSVAFGNHNAMQTISELDSRQAIDILQQNVDMVYQALGKSETKKHILPTHLPKSNHPVPIALAEVGQSIHQILEMK